MEKKSAIYAVARIRGHENDLIGLSRMQRLVDAPLDEAYRLLQDMGYGSGETMDPAGGDIERMIEAELMAAYDLVNEVTPDRAATDVFLLRADVQNLKILLKQKALESEDSALLASGGLYDTEMLKHMVSGADYGAEPFGRADVQPEYAALPEIIAEAARALESQIAQGEINPMRISVAMDGAYNAYARGINEDSKKRPFLKEYFTAVADFDNLITVLRIQRMNIGEVDIAKMLLPAGEIDIDKLKLALRTPIENYPGLIEGVNGYENMRRALMEIAQGAPIAVLERERDNFLMELTRRGKEDIDTVGPVIGYLLAREQEAKCIRLVITAKRNGLPDSVIQERMRMLYGS